MLWIALYLPELPLQSAARGTSEHTPLVLSEGPTHRLLVAAANAGARQLGIQSGMTLAAAQALAGGDKPLLQLPRDLTAERDALHTLAGWAGQFTPVVSLENQASGGQGLLLEVGASLQLFGGLMPLLSRIRQGLAELGYSAIPGVAPTPLAAWWLARARHVQVGVRSCNDPAQLAERLRPLPIIALGWPETTVQSLAALGIHKLGACMELPRDGLARRLGPDILRHLDKALGRLPDPRTYYEAPEFFASHVDLPAEIAHTEALQFPLKRLLTELQGFLRGRGQGVQKLDLLLEHTAKRRTRVSLGLAASERDAARLLALFRERLGRATLPDAVVGLALRADHLLPFEPESASLVPEQGSRSRPWRHLHEQLQARLGGAQVFALATADDHRPERAWKKAPVLPATQLVNGAPAAALINKAGNAVGSTTSNTAAAAQDGQTPTRHPLAWLAERIGGLTSQVMPAMTQTPAQTRSPLRPQRPVWLLQAPKPLSSRDDQPEYHGPLDLLTGPERIESGWWDGHRASRDYYVAKNRRGELLWVYRDHQPAPAWYLHGVFA